MLNIKSFSIIYFFFGAGFLVSCKTSQTTPTNLSYKPQHEFIFGVTVDNITPLKEIIHSLSRLQKKMTVRIVFDEFKPALYYQNAVQQISEVSFIMAELLDSQYVTQYTAQAYQKRTVEYLNLFQNKVDIWEVGNEINGEWLGETKAVVAKVTAALKAVKSRNKKAAITLYYNENCWQKKSHEMFTWTQKNITSEIKDNLDYIFVSYYEEDCNGLEPDWSQVFNRLSLMFPNSKIGFGEVGTKNPALKAEYLKKYYKIRIPNSHFVGGFFWWYFVNDMVPSSKPLWPVLNSVLH